MRCPPTPGQAEALTVSAVAAGHLLQTLDATVSLRVRPLSDAPAGHPVIACRHQGAALRDAMAPALLSDLGTGAHLTRIGRFGVTRDGWPPETP